MDDDIIEYGIDDVVMVFHADDTTTLILPRTKAFITEPDPMWKAMLVAALFFEDDEEINAMRRRLEDISDEIGQMSLLDQDEVAN